VLRSGEIASKPNSPGRVIVVVLETGGREDRESALAGSYTAAARRHEQPPVRGQSARLAHAGHGRDTERAGDFRRSDDAPPDLVDVTVVMPAPRVAV
jgi:hypothetical protein